MKKKFLRHEMYFLKVWTYTLLKLDMHHWDFKVDRNRAVDWHITKSLIFGGIPTEKINMGVISIITDIGIVSALESHDGKDPTT